MIGKEKTENYLKVIYKLQSSGSRVKGVNVASELNVSRPTVCVALKELRKKGYIMPFDDGSFMLTRKGVTEAQDVENRFNFFKDMLTFLNVDKDIAEEDACRMEHTVSEESYRALQQFFSAKMAQGV